MVVSSAAINDYELDCVEATCDGIQRCLNSAEKISSGAEEVVLKLRPAPKLIDQLPSWGHRGPLVAFKYEDAGTVVASATRLLQWVDAHLVVANSLCSQVQSLVDADGVHEFASREALLVSLAQRVALLSKGSLLQS